MSFKHSKRRTSKLFLLVNTVLAWGLAFYGVYADQAAAVVASSLALVGALYGAYTGIGHLDYRRFLHFFSQAEPYSPDAMAPQELEDGGPSSDPVGFVRFGNRPLSEGEGPGPAGSRGR